MQMLSFVVDGRQQQTLERCCVDACGGSTSTMGGGRRSRKLGKMKVTRGVRRWVGMIFIYSVTCGKGGILGYGSVYIHGTTEKQGCGTTERLVMGIPPL